MEQMTNCNDCRKKEFSLREGNLCSLTHQKPNFEGSCPYFDPIPEEEKPRTLTDGYEKERISGWLVVFLWLGLGGGALMTIFNTLPYLSMFAPLMQFVALTLMGTAVITAVAAILAFYKREPNAVSLAVTYIVMIVLDGVMSIIIGMITDMPDDMVTTIRPFVWAAIWFSYLMMSNKVANLIPKETRRWCWFEKVMMGINVLATVIFMSLFHSMFNGNASPSSIYDPEQFIEQSIAEVNKQCPMYLGEGMWMISQTKTDTEIIITTKLDFDDEQFSSWEWNEIAHEAKYEMLADKSWIDEDPFVKLALDKNYFITFAYVDREMDPLYSMTFHINDFE